MGLSAAPARTPLRLWLERFAIGLVAVVSLLVPLVIGLLFYLALTDGIVINSGNPERETRLWMIRETRGATGLGLSVSTPANTRTDTLCAQTHVTFLKWDRTVRLETAGVFCRCFERQDNQTMETGIACP